jgi:hypothetical protein
MLAELTMITRKELVTNVAKLTMLINLTLIKTETTIIIGKFVTKITTVKI